MNGVVPVDAVLPLTGAVNAGILAVAISLRRSTGAPHVPGYASAFLAIVSAVIFVIVADHAGFGAGWLSLSGIERSLTILSGPVLLLFVAALLKQQMDWRIASIPALSLWIADRIGVAAFGDELPFWLIVAAQAGHTVAALALALLFKGEGLRSAQRRKRFVLTVIAMMLTIHFAQAVRFIAPDVASLQNLVPNVAGAAVLVLALFVFWSAKLPAFDLLISPGSTQDADAVSGIVTRLDEALVAGRLARDPGLKAADAAAAIGISARELAQALAEARGTTFPEYVVRTRVSLALQLLRDPAERRTSMEAIGMLAGFGSRSAFYGAFTKHVGESPSALRRRLAENPCPES